jgi:lipopolysaccharide biosynthesis glycosyltransferase
VIPVYIGFDRVETIAWHVLVASIIKRTRSPVAFTPIGNETLSPLIWKRPRGPKDSTEFSNARFMVPFLADYQGWAIFMDCDMVCGENIASLWEQRREEFAVMCVKHQHVPREHTKFLGQAQTQYGRKNWSSLMLINCAHPSTKNLTPEYVASTEGLSLHSMDWAEGHIGSITGSWNVLSTSRTELEHPTYKPGEPVALLHYTRGGLWHGEFFAGLNAWADELGEVLVGGNPKATSACHLSNADEALTVSIRYGKEVIERGEDEEKGQG